MLTYEEALYHKLLLVAGENDQFELLLDHLLEDEDPLSEVALNLSACRGDHGAIIDVLNHYLSTAGEGQIDVNAVFDRIVAYLRQWYEAKPDKLKELANIMYLIASGPEQYYVDPWLQLNNASDEYDLVSIGVLRESKYRKLLKAFLYDGKPVFSSGQ